MTTENPPAVVDDDEFTVRRTVMIAAPVERVWAAVTEAEHIERWFPQSARLPVVAAGAEGVFGFEGHGEFPVRIEEVDPPRSIAYRWGNDSGHSFDLDLRSTVFRFTLEAVDGGTRLTVVESGFGALPDPSESMESNRGGWDWELDELVAYLEGDAPKRGA